MRRLQMVGPGLLFCILDEGFSWKHPDTKAAEPIILIDKDGFGARPATAAATSRLVMTAADARARASSIIFAWLLPGSAWLEHFLMVDDKQPLITFFFTLDSIYFAFTRQSMLHSQQLFNSSIWIAASWYLAQYFLHFDNLKKEHEDQNSFKIEVDAYWDQLQIAITGPLSSGAQCFITEFATFAIELRIELKNKLTWAAVYRWKAILSARELVLRTLEILPRSLTVPVANFTQMAGSYHEDALTPLPAYVPPSLPAYVPPYTSSGGAANQTSLGAPRTCHKCNSPSHL